MTGQHEFSYTNHNQFQGAINTPTGQIVSSNNGGIEAYTGTSLNKVERGYWASWHFRYLRIARPDGGVNGKCSLFEQWIGNGSVSNHHGLGNNVAYPIDGMLHGAIGPNFLNPNGYLDMGYIAPPNVTGTFHFELIQIPLPKYLVEYQAGEDLVFLLTPQAEIVFPSTTPTIVPRPRIFKCIQDTGAMQMNQYPWYGSDWESYWDLLEDDHGMGIGVDWFTSVKAYNSGKYWDIATKSCTSTRPPRTDYYDCIALSGGNCQQVGYTTGYTSLSACQAAFPNGCQTPPVEYYDCDEAQGCIQVNYATSYTTLAACQQAYPSGCGDPPTTYYDCHQGSCQQVSYETLYTSLGDCEDAFPEGCDDPPPPVEPPHIPCLDEYAYKSFCAIKDHECNNEILCKNKDFLTFLKLMSVSTAGLRAAEISDANAIENITNLINTLCECKNC
tara:strand:- start:3669 stop:4997 length:1329 start_codon:yes stop_codon:yes gene_type:complete